MAKKPTTKPQSKGSNKPEAKSSKSVSKLSAKAAVKTEAKPGAKVAKPSAKNLAAKPVAKAAPVAATKANGKGVAKATAPAGGKAALSAKVAKSATKVEGLKASLVKTAGTVVSKASAVVNKVTKTSPKAADSTKAKSPAKLVAPVVEPKKVAASPKGVTAKNAAGKVKAEPGLVATSAPSVIATSIINETPRGETAAPAATPTKTKPMKLEGTPEEWKKLQAKFKADSAQLYDIKGNFEATRPLQHKVFGWGWVISNDNDRLEVLFQDGKRVLISNRK